MFRFLRRIQHLYTWFPIIWKDEDWDCVYLFEIMRFKISRMRKNIQKNKRHVGYAKVSQDMRIVELLLERHAFSDFYYENNKCNQEFCTCGDNKNFDTIERKDGLIEWINPFCEWCKLSAKRRKRFKKEKDDFDLIWETIKKHSQKWWD